MNVVKTLKFVLRVKASAGGNVYVPPTVCLRPAYTGDRAAAYVERTGSVRTNVFAGIRPATGLGWDTSILELG